MRTALLLPSLSICVSIHICICTVFVHEWASAASSLLLCIFFFCSSILVRNILWLVYGRFKKFIGSFDGRSIRRIVWFFSSRRAHTHRYVWLLAHSATAVRREIVVLCGATHRRTHIGSAAGIRGMLREGAWDGTRNVKLTAAVEKFRSVHRSCRYYDALGSLGGHGAGDN